MKAKVKFGSKITLEIEDRDDLETLSRAIVLSNPPSRCDCCGETKLFRPSSNKDKEGNNYINIICGKCGAKAKLGLLKSGGFFWHSYEKYVPKK